MDQVDGDDPAVGRSLIWAAHLPRLEPASIARPPVGRGAMKSSRSVRARGGRVSAMRLSTVASTASYDGPNCSVRDARSARRSRIGGHRSVGGTVGFVR